MNTGGLRGTKTQIYGIREGEKIGEEGNKWMIFNLCWVMILQDKLKEAVHCMFNNNRNIR